MYLKVVLEAEDTMHAMHQWSSTHYWHVEPVSAGNSLTLGHTSSFLRFPSMQQLAREDEQHREL